MIDALFQGGYDTSKHVLYNFLSGPNSGSKNVIQTDIGLNDFMIYECESVPAAGEETDVPWSWSQSLPCSEHNTRLLAILYGYDVYN